MWARPALREGKVRATSTLKPSANVACALVVALSALWVPGGKLDRLRLTRRGIAFSPRHLDQRLDQRRQSIDFLLYP